MDLDSYQDYAKTMINLFQATVGAFDYSVFNLSSEVSFTEKDNINLVKLSEYIFNLETDKYNIGQNLNISNLYFSFEGMLLLTLWLIFSLIILLNLLIALLAKE